MSAYIIVDIRVNNAAEYEKYKALAKPLVEQYGGKYLVRGGTIDLREDDLWSPERIVLLEFPDVESAQRFIDSDDYAPVAPLRRANADCTLFIVDGVEAT